MVKMKAIPNGGNDEMTRPFLSVVIPSFRGHHRLPPFLDDLIATIGNQLHAHVEFLVVDDGSPRDEQHLVAGEIARRNGPDAIAAAYGSDNPVRISCRSVCLPGNRGQQYATILGVAAATGELIATIDDDGAHPPAELIRMVRYMMDHPETDLIYGAPFRNDRSVRRLGTVMNNTLFSLFVGKPWDVPVTSFRVIRQSLVRCALEEPVSFPYLSAMLFSCRPVSAVHRYNPPGGTAGSSSGQSGSTGESRYSLKGLSRIFWNLVLFWGPLRGIGRLIRTPRRVEIPPGCD